MDLEKEVEKIYGKTPANKIEELERIYGNNEGAKNKGYLICNNCLGYYKLKENESPEDFKGCECGSPLEYRENINNLKKPGIFSSFNKFYSTYHEPDYTYNTLDEFNNEYYDEYAELQQIVDIIRVKAQERKRFLEKLYENVKKQEIILNSINQEKIIEVRDNNWSLWNYLEEKNIEKDLNDQKIIIDEILEQENRLLSHVKDKRNKKSFNTKTITNYSYGKISIMTLVIVLISIIAIYAVK